MDLKKKYANYTHWFLLQLVFRLTKIAPDCLPLIHFHFLQTIIFPHFRRSSYCFHVLQSNGSHLVYIFLRVVHYFLSTSWCLNVALFCYNVVRFLLLMICLLQTLSFLYSWFFVLCFFVQFLSPLRLLGLVLLLSCVLYFALHIYSCFCYLRYLCWYIPVTTDFFF